MLGRGKYMSLHKKQLYINISTKNSFPEASISFHCTPKTNHLINCTERFRDSSHSFLCVLLPAFVVR
ncbi:unnamed protein product [Citrullus colocynthis]|uniref:Uncharacterized protein n=1 Tax=Citrullus colocynthis TaxID=252529 RepID=A0ABP0Y8X4_9ROSI